MNAFPPLLNWAALPACVDRVGIMQEVLHADADSSTPLQLSRDRLCSTPAEYDGGETAAGAAATAMQPSEAVTGVDPRQKSLLRMAALVDALEAEQKLTVRAPQRRPCRFWKASGCSP